MAETHVCVVTANGAVIHNTKVPSTPADIAAELAQVPPCRRIVFETGRMAPMLYHGLSQLGRRNTPFLGSPLPTTEPILSASGKSHRPLPDVEKLVDDYFRSIFAQ
jgi:hypothetical protein